MALFIRKRPQERCSPAEIEVAELLTELDDRWLIRWGFIYRDKHGTPREGDFLISGPDGGALVLEVKAGPVSLNPYTGQWSTADGDDPSEQLHAEYTGVKQALVDHQGQQPSVYVGRALGTPHLTLSPGTESHHGIPREYLFDRRDLRQFVKTWTERMRQWNAHLNRTDREVLERAFGAEGSPKSIRTFIDDIDLSASLMLVDKASACPTDGLHQKFRVVRETAKPGRTPRKHAVIKVPLTPDEQRHRILCQTNVDHVCRVIEEETFKVTSGLATFAERIDWLAGHYERDEKIVYLPSTACAGCEFKATPEEKARGLKNGFEECWKQAFKWRDKDFEAPNVLNIWNLKRKAALIAESRVAMADVVEADIKPKSDGKPGISPSQRQWLQVEKAQKRDGELW